MEIIWTFILKNKPEEYHWLAAIIFAGIIFGLAILIFFDHYWILPDGSIGKKPSIYKFK